MKFGPVPVGEAEGAIVAHAIRHSGLVLKKGDLIRPEHVVALQQAGLNNIVVARLEEGDISEDDAAAVLAARMRGPGLRVDAAFTGRANLFAEAAGLLQIDASVIDAVNARDESITVATLPHMRAVVAGEMVGTVKIIPFAVPRRTLDATLALCADPPLSVTPFRPLRVAVVSTLLPGLKPSVVDKTVRVLRTRLAPARASIVVEEQTPHEEGALAAVLARLAGAADLTIVFGASAITDRRDVIPAALERTGGAIVHFGMPVDPGNLLLLGADATGAPVLGAPGCARSPKENGFDWVLQRLLAGVPVTPADVTRMGVGGLLMEIVSRPQPREGGASEAEADGD